MNNRLYLWSVVAALAGFLFGFDTVVISGAEQKIQALWNLSGHMHGFAMAAALYGTVVGSLIGAWPTDRWGRKKTLLWIGIFYFVSAVWSGLATHVWTLSIARFIGGLGVGVSTITAPLYISEISPPDRRGRLTGMFQFNIVLGILVAFFSNYLLGNIGENDWRWMLGVEAIPAFIYILACFSLPESPRWLIGRGRRAEGEAVLQLVTPQASKQEVAAMAEGIAQAATASAANSSGFWGKGLRIPVMLAFIIAAFNQLSGINVILYFAPRLLGLAGIEQALLASITIGVVNLVFTFVGLWLIDKLGRKTLLTIGSLGYILSLGICAWAFLSIGEFKTVSKSIDLIETAGRVAKIEGGELKLLPEDVAAAKANYEKAKSVYFETVGGAAPENATAAAMGELAAASKSAAAKALGGKSSIVLICILLFIASHAVGQGAVIWVFISEIFPNKFRAPGQALGSATHWVFAAALTQLFPIAIAKFDAGYHFAFFCGMMILQLVWVKTMVKETKGRSLEDIQRDLGMA
jgi:MFS transporter, SP family, arabinose:H+ symporter